MLHNILYTVINSHEVYKVVIKAPSDHYLCYKASDGPFHNVLTVSDSCIVEATHFTDDDTCSFRAINGRYFRAGLGIAVAPLAVTASKEDAHISDLQVLAPTDGYTGSGPRS